MTIQGVEYPENHNIIARANQGPFSCKNCEYWDKESTVCKEKHIIQLAEKKNKYGIVKILGHAYPLHADDCCDFFEHK